ncbi:RES family NAD+ phosphorylase [Stenotrophobium rhamnosiphilum]|uniref:RES domain-containing protein n=1 Tax=Stenotrophobium rhamnosiphilum TaxID=2029166 RepID=A0A2T5MIK4_9GAMM|nr:RES family NAD+ phosphorylase [Stenotrophobium rhamnosiphilum]PTU32411.1 RES domain-containing protein [Stenotrophobium rhamnosiphilum]
MDSALCSQCSTDKFLASIIDAQGELIECSICSKDVNKAMSVEDLGKLIEPILREHFEPGDIVHRIGEGDDDRVYDDQQGDDMAFIVQSVIGDNYPFEDELVDAVCAAEDCDPRSGDECFWDSTTNYVETRTAIAPLEKHWHPTLAELKTTRRFYSPLAKKLFDALFADVETLYCYERSSSSLKAAKVPVVRIIPKGRRLYRARICLSTEMLQQIADDPLTHVGPPPAAATRAGRMNAEGITVLYTSLNRATAVAELRPAIGNDVVSIRLKTTRQLRLLDFGRFEKARPRKQLSYFQPDFNAQIEMSALSKRLHKLISMPIVPGKESDYLITQNMAEYLAHVHPLRFDGVIFQSAQKLGGINAVIFSDDEYFLPASEAFRVAYVKDSLKMQRVGSVSYRLTPIALAKTRKGKVHVLEVLGEDDESIDIDPSGF